MAIFNGTPNGDVIITASQDDTVNGLEGDDWIVITPSFALAATGNDVIFGGSGDDTLSLAGLSSNLVIDLRITTVQAFAVGSVTISSIENLVGGFGNDRFYGTTGNNTMRGNAGDDTLSGLAGNDYLIGGPGNDRYYGSSGIDTASFQEISDDYILNNDLQYIQVDLRNTGYQVTGEGLDRFSGIENLVGSQLSDFFTGNSVANDLRGQAGDDVLDGGTGIDRLTGGTGDDIFVFGSDGGTYTGSATGDIIVDFTRGSDVIDVTDFGANDPNFDIATSVIQRTSGSNTIIEIAASTGSFYRMTLLGNYSLNESDFIF